MPNLKRSGRRRLAICMIAGALSVSCSGEDRGSGQSLPAGPTTTVVADSSTTAAPETTATVGGADPSTDPCVIAEPEMVEEAFGGAALGELRIGVTCRYGLEGGAAQWADVLWIGPADEWEELKSTYAETRGGIILADILGAEGFHPVDHGVRDLIFRTGENVYAVLGFGGPTPETLAALGDAVLTLAEAIVELEQ
jgi:hypothetical protein